MRFSSWRTRTAGGRGPAPSSVRDGAEAREERPPQALRRGRPRRLIARTPLMAAGVPRCRGSGDGGARVRGRVLPPLSS